MKTRQVLVAALALILLMSAVSVTALAADSPAGGLVLLYGADTDNSNITGNYWNGFIVADPYGSQYVLAGSDSYFDFNNEVYPADHCMVWNDNGSAEITAEIYDTSAGVALYKVNGTLESAKPLVLAGSSHISIGDTVTVWGFEWDLLGSGSTIRNMHSSYETVIESSFTGDKFSFYSLADGAPNINWESAAVINDEGYVVGILVADGDMNSFFPMDKIINALGFNGDTTGKATVSKKKTEGGSKTAIIVMISVIAIIVAAAVVMYRKKVEAGYIPSRHPKESEQEPDIPVAGNYRPGEKLCIIGISGYYAGQKFRINGEVTLGRSAARCNLVFPEGSRSISSVHCMIRQRGDHLEVKDLGSTHGTFCRGIQVASNTPVLLSPGERFYLATPQNTFEVSL